MALIKSSENTVFNDDFLFLLSQEYDVCLDTTMNDSCSCSASNSKNTTTTTTTAAKTKESPDTSVVTNSRPERVYSSDFSTKIGGELWFLNHTNSARSGVVEDSTITSLNTITSIGTMTSIGTSESAFFRYFSTFSRTTSSNLNFLSTNRHQQFI